MAALAAGFASLAHAQTYRSTVVDRSGKLTIISTSGSRIVPPLLKGQEAFQAARISPDHRTVGWLVLYPSPTSGNDTAYARQNPIAGKLVIYRGGRVLRAISTDQVFWDWRFEEQGHSVAYSTGPTHGGAEECVLLDVVTGKPVARWSAGHGEAPAWAADLRR
jgi:hypothetical protein